MENFSIFTSIEKYNSIAITIVTGKLKKHCYQSDETSIFEYFNLASMEKFTILDLCIDYVCKLFYVQFKLAYRIS